MSRVETGLERWLRGDAEPVPAGSRIGLLLHPASVDSAARPALAGVRDANRFRVERLFAPEHGLGGREQDMERVCSSTEPTTGLPVVSLYGDTVDSLRPRAEDLEMLDAVVCDLQDVGSRYYTFVYTLSFLMEAASDVGVAVVVLDRPNPLGGSTLEGPVLDPELASFVGRYPLPVRHGMTVGELAGMFNEGFGIGCDLRVVEMGGWRRSMRFEDTGLPWVPPSPNVPTPATARVYPGGCLIEGTNLSEGRGTTTPFELVGAPWIDGERLAAALSSEDLDGALFRPATFRPMFQKHAGQSCSGIQVIVNDPDSFRPFAAYLTLIREARRQSGDAFEWRTEAYEFETSRLAIDLLLGRSDLRPLLESGARLAAMQRLWEDDLDQFRASRRPFLLYR
jgi:uncharacterized protein YbbC (DUF1343 family)